MNNFQIINKIYFNYFILGLHHSECIPLTIKPDDTTWPYLHHAQFTPAGSAIIMVYNYDIYYRRGPRYSQSYRVTNDAIAGVIYNGIPDWLYEGESIFYQFNYYLY